MWQIPQAIVDTPKRVLPVHTIVLARLCAERYRRKMELRPGNRHMLRAIAMFGFAALFLLISPSLRESVLFGLGQMMLELSKYSPYSYIGLAIVLGTGAVKSLAAPRPQ